MAEYVLSEKSKSDLRRIWHYTVEVWSIDQARRYYNEILDACDDIAECKVVKSPSFESIYSGVHGYRINHHVIFYRVLSKNRIRVIRILHERMDYLQHL